MAPNRNQKIAGDFAVTKPRFATYAYVVAMTLVLLAIANHLVAGLNVDPLTVAQNQRVMFIGARYPGDPVFAGLPQNQPERLSLLYVGNSQSYAVMDYSPGDRSMIAWLSYLLNGGDENASSRFAVRYGSDPNLRMSELLVKSAVAATDRAHRPDVVVAGIVLDSFRWLDARPEVAVTAASGPAREVLLQATRTQPELPLANQVVAAVTGLAANPGAGARPAVDPSGLHKRLLNADEALQAQLDARFALFAHRKDVYSWLAAHYMAGRNALARVDTATRRPVPPELYRANLELMELTVRLLRAHGVQPILYFAPIRPVEPNPYDPADVARFRRDFLEVCRRSGALCFDYSNLIPEDMWTNYPEDVPSSGGQRDYAHFTNRAHRRLAEQLQSDAGAALHGWLAAKASHAQAVPGS